MDGADFKIKIRKVEGWTNYDKSEFSTPSALAGGDDAELERIYSKLYSLSEFTNPDNYKTYAELKAKMNRVLGVDAGETMEAPEMHYAPAPGEKTLVAEDIVTDTSSDNEEDTLSYFAKLAKEG